MVRIIGEGTGGLVPSEYSHPKLSEDQKQSLSQMIRQLETMQKQEDAYKKLIAEAKDQLISLRHKQKQERDHNRLLEINRSISDTEEDLKHMQNKLQESQAEGVSLTNQIVFLTLNDNSLDKKSRGRLFEYLNELQTPSEASRSIQINVLTDVKGWEHLS